jgi:tetratricopeptide (TPR) repeat protein
MSRTLNLCDHLLLQVRKYQSLGVDDRALRILGNLSRLGELPADAAEETQVRLAELLLKQRKFARARRHLAAALAHQEDNAQYHYLMAWAVEGERGGTPGRALHHYQRCVELDQDNPHYHADAGSFALGHGQVEQGLGWLRRAVELAPDDVELVGQVVRGLLDAGHTDEARQMARAALFRNSGDRRFRQLWNDFRFQELHQEQQQARKQRYIRGAIAEGRICLSFQQMTVETANGRRVVRRDGPSPSPSHRPAPHFLRLARLSERKHA